MPVSKKRKKNTPTISGLIVPASRRLPAGSRNEFGTTDVDREFGTWIEDVLLETSPPERFLLASAAASWLGVFDPTVHTLRQCWIASTYIKEYLKSFEVDARAWPVHAAIYHHGVKVSAVGSMNPGQAGPDGMWNGHSVTVIPALNAILDLTIGQDTVLGCDAALRLPVYWVSTERDLTQLVHGDTVTVHSKDRPGYSITYTFHDMDPGYGASKQGRLLMREAVSAATEQAGKARVGLAPFLSGLGASA